MQFERLPSGQVKVSTELGDTPRDIAIFVDAAYHGGGIIGLMRRRNINRYLAADPGGTSIGMSPERLVEASSRLMRITPDNAPTYYQGTGETAEAARMAVHQAGVTMARQIIDGHTQAALAA